MNSFVFKRHVMPGFNTQDDKYDQQLIREIQKILVLYGRDPEEWNVVELVLPVNNDQHWFCYVITPLLGVVELCDSLYEKQSKQSKKLWQRFKNFYNNQNFCSVSNNLILLCILYHLFKHTVAIYVYIGF
jgi:hypothetical protein